MTTKHRMTEREAKEFSHLSPMNAALVCEHFTCGCMPYEDIFTFDRWIAQGMCVQKGQKGFQINTFRPVKKVIDGEEKIVGSRPWRVTLFCRHQVAPLQPK